MTIKTTNEKIRRIIREELRKLNESGLNRIHHHIMSHDCAVMTGFRNDTKDFAACVIGSSTTEKNKDRNKELRAYLLKNGYGVTSVKGTYVENYMSDNEVEVKEDSYFVVNLRDDQKFVDEIEKLGQHFCQDAVLIIPMEEHDDGTGEIVSDKPYLLGTNNSWPGLGDKQELNYFKGGVSGEFMTKVKGRPIVFEGDEKPIKLEEYGNYARMGKWSITEIARKLKKKLDKTEE